MPLSADARYHDKGGVTHAWGEENDEEHPFLLPGMQEVVRSERSTTRMHGSMATDVAVLNKDSDDECNYICKYALKIYVRWRTRREGDRKTEKIIMTVCNSLSNN